MAESERALWMSIRAALLMAVKAIEVYVGVRRPAIMVETESASGTSTPIPVFKGQTPTS